MKNQTLFDQAKKLIPGGVNSPVRAFTGVGGTPKFIEKAQGAYLYDADGQKYIDYVGSWGPMILGHAHPTVTEAVKEALDKGLSYGAPCSREIELAEIICNRMPSIEQVRMVNSGTEATMSAIRLARGYTGRDKIIKFNGCYHGHADHLLVKAGSGMLTLGIPGSPGVPESFAQHTLTAEFNNLSQVEAIFEKHPNDIGAIIIEPIAGNMNCILPQTNFLQGLRELCNRFGAVLIFDEVMTGFRVGLGGAQSIYNVTPDLTTLGKVIGGGMPVGAFGGKKEIMQALAPVGPVYQAGTLSGNPLAMTAGIATLRECQAPGFYEHLTNSTKTLLDGLQACADAANIPFTHTMQGGMFGYYFTDSKNIANYSDTANTNIERFKTFFHAMLEQGVYFAPSAFEAGFVSQAHSQQDIDRTIKIAESVMSRLAVSAEA